MYEWTEKDGVMVANIAGCALRIEPYGDPDAMMFKGTLDLPTESVGLQITTYGPLGKVRAGLIKYAEESIDICGHNGLL